jgi:ring-1,2-phenylacetyl-CoA epoxidase subunit PaaA
MLLTVLGDAVLPSGGRVWLQTLTSAAGAIDISPDATRQALRRLANQGIVVASHEGRNARYELTEAGRRRLADAAERIYLRRPLVWDGRWHMLTYTFAERERAARDALRRELEWLGFGSLGAGVWVCPWDLGVRLQEVLDKHRIAGSVEVFTAVHDGEDRHLAARAYPLDDLQTAHAGFVRHVRAAGAVPDDPQQAFAERIRLVHDWRKFLFLDPGLPEDLLPDDWLGSDAAAAFVDRYRSLEAPAWTWWDEVVADADPDGTIPDHPASNLVGTRVTAPPASTSAASPVDELPAEDTARSGTTGDPDAARTEEFLERLHAGTKVEPDDWMPDTYRQLNLKFIEMHANSEIMGALPEREWIARAPSLRRKRSLAAKVQDEVGHGQLIYRVAESLGKPRQQMYEDLVMGRSKFHNVFHYPTHTWGDVACIGFLVDGAAIVTQRALLSTSYAPYVRVMKRVVAEESLHYRHGEDIMLALAAGSDEQFEMLQEAVNRWWEPVMHFFGTDIAAEDDPMIHWGVKTQTNEASRQAWMSQYVPKLWDMGIEVPDTSLHWDGGADRWVYDEPDWDRLMAIVKGDPTPATATRLYWRQLMHENHDWIRDIILGDDPGFVTAA